MAISEEQEQDLNENMEEIVWVDRNAEAYDVGVVNTFFQTKLEHLITYKRVEEEGQ